MTAVKYDVNGKLITSYQEAKKLAEELGVRYKVVYIPARCNEDLNSKKTEEGDE